MKYIYSQTQFKDAMKDEGFKGLHLEKTDKNGTQYFTGLKDCWKCMGHREFECWGHISGGICFACNGTGVNNCEVKVMTDEHYKKLEEKRQAKLQKKIEKRKANAPELNQQFFKDYGFNEEGKAWCVVKAGYVPKDFTEKMLELGAKKYGWNIYIFSKKVEGLDAVEVDAKDCCEKDIYDVYYEYDYHFFDDLIADAQKKEEQANAERTSYFGAIGDKVCLDLTFKNVFFYDTQFGGMCIYIFEDAEGHQFKWNTSSGFNSSLEEGEHIKVNATIKEHSEYKGIKQTVLIRCKMVA